ncbi:hypothetical protein LXL04_036161 [Taraxacum kok-saghyz]
MKLEDKELAGGCNGDSEEEDSNRREIPEAVKVAGGRREIPEAVKVAGGLSALMMEEEPKNTAVIDLCKGRLRRFVATIEIHLVPEEFVVISPALSLERVHHIHGGNSLPACVLCVGNNVYDDIFEKDLQNSASFLIDQTADTFHTSSSR